jgi:hypothetical protein
MINSGLAPVFIVPDHEVVQNTMLLTKTIRLEIMSLFIWNFSTFLQNTQIHSLQNQKVLD